jgi:hypothetical protein
MLAHAHGNRADSPPFRLASERYVFMSIVSLINTTAPSAKPNMHPSRCMLPKPVSFMLGATYRVVLIGLGHEKGTQLFSSTFP